MEKFPETPPQLVESSIPRKQLYRGLDESLAQQLIAKSRQDHILEATPNDATSRFLNIESLNSWQSQGREVYALTGGTRLAGVVWYGEKPMPVDIGTPRLPNHTFAIRIYKPYVGKGLAEPLMRDSLKDYLHLIAERGQAEDFKGIWLSTKRDNENARHLYKNFGYKEVVFSGEEVIMVLPQQRMVEILGA
jgi:GNAT superfamily N-acetyltransferase